MIPHVREYLTSAKPYPVLLLHVPCQTAAAEPGKRTNTNKKEDKRLFFYFLIYIDSIFFFLNLS